MILEVNELGFMILVIYIGLEPYPIGSEIIFDFLKIVGHTVTMISAVSGYLPSQYQSYCRYLFKEDVPQVVTSLTDQGVATSLSASYYHTGAVLKIL